MQGFAESKKSLCECGRPLWQHEHGLLNDGEESKESYTVYSMSCPAKLAVAEAHGMWRQVNKDVLESYSSDPCGKPEPGSDLAWFGVGKSEAQPSFEHPLGG